MMSAECEQFGISLIAHNSSLNLQHRVDICRHALAHRGVRQPAAVGRVLNGQACPKQRS
jgi:hypothetical protein